MEQFNEKFPEHVEEIMAAERGDKVMREKHPHWESQAEQLRVMFGMNAHD